MRRLTGFGFGDPSGPRTGATLGDLDTMMDPFTDGTEEVS